ncbi:hypothetical protein AALO_G00004900 [Alosa alosa]|uniref:Ig-like domain-containing protein n=1 Tax=Alosa alosa TaxID=278164 RepID=A0AAV6HDY0_9TELE|nr:hypothetical protein AALO_G00004900 [Alosa alosa]
MCIFSILFLTMLTGQSSGNPITSNRAEITTMERSNTILSCNYSSAVTLQWYRQCEGSTPTFLMNVFGEKDQRYEEDGRITGRLNKEKTQVFLEISSTRVSDSALYYCAMQPTVMQHPAAPYKNICSSAKVESTVVLKYSMCFCLSFWLF